jgi:hypothetical protein
MAVLTPQQRNTLESAVKQARKIAEVGAFNALKAMAVNHPEPFSHMSAEQRTLRNSLRSKARLLGDELPANGAQRIDNLSYELAYETWHKMLFAKFLEANDLLIHTASGVSVSMEDCEELASDEGYLDKWDAAANYASKMLPAIFRIDDPLMQVTFATDERIKLEEIIDGLEREIFVADDALGWVYQFWQSEAKAVINASGDKIDGAKLPAVTQLFTEPYMVHFLIDNTLGAWWVSRNPGVHPPVKFEYLRLLDNGTPAAGNFEGWPDKTAEVTSLDPCMGSGHFVTSLFHVFAALRMHEERLSKEDATDRVIAENLHGLELDARCTQISAFNLALTAWKFCGHYKELPEMNLACSGIAPKGKVEDWVKLGAGDIRLENGMRLLYQIFKNAPELGSLIDPSTVLDNSMAATPSEMIPVLERLIEKENNNGNTEQVAKSVIAYGISKAAKLLAQQYTLQITNVPYLGKGKFDKTLIDYVVKHYGDAKGDLSTVFYERLLKTANPDGTICTVIPQNWLFLTTYKKYREKLLQQTTWDVLARLGAGAFSQISGEVVKAILIAITKRHPTPEHSLFGLDVSESPNAAAKDEALKIAELKTVKQKEQLGNPDAVVAFDEIKSENLLNRYSYSHHGLTTGDLPRMAMLFWEFGFVNKSWIPFQTTTKQTQYFGGLESVLRWEDGKGAINQLLGARKDGTAAWSRKGVVISQMGEMPASIYWGSAFDNNTAVIIPNKEEHFEAIWSYCSSVSYNEAVRKIDQSLAVTSGTMAKIPFDLEYWQKVANEKYPNGLPKPYSDDPTQWLFHGHPIKTDKPLQVALARMLGYSWPAESDTEMELADEARALIEQVKAFDHLSDEDGIFCIPSVNAEQAGADRFRTYLQTVFADSWGNNTITELLEKEGATAANLEEWLRKEFFVQHCKVFQNRPFIWHIWDGRNDGFSALVNYHKLDKENLSKLIYTYLGDWIRMCEAKKKNDESGAEGLLSAALKLKEKLEAILHGEAPYDIFIRWKSLAEQPIGWEPDLNDGVRINIRPFMEADVLRKKPNIKWGVDRGKNAPGSPWGEIRDNDKHLTLAEKRDARENKI